MSQDNRKTPRVPIELRVDYKKMNTFFADYTKNISKGGTFIKTEKPLKQGTEFIFKLVIPDVREPVELRGRVMWIKREGDTHHPEEPDPGMGIKFIYDDDSQRRDFEALVERMMRESLGDHLFSKLMHKD
ncbi:MAG: TIGR02266 family protein [Deltaproteobacteria bacterium]|nr:TIGR02266 family protein [Deltaproteobacteria bacterium]